MDVPTTMRAAFRTEYGDYSVLDVEDVPVPEPGSGELLIKVMASSVNKGDQLVLRGEPWMMRLMTGCCGGGPKKRGVGQDYAGQVVQVGPDVDEFEVGDAVFGEATFGETMAEFAVVKAAGAAAKPSSLTFAQAAALPVAGATAYKGLVEVAGITRGDRVCVVGGSGSVGPYAVMIAKALGAAHVTAVVHSRNASWVKSIGADTVFAYDKKKTYIESDFVYDIMFDVVRSHSVRANCRLIESDGTYLIVGGGKGKCLGGTCGLLCNVTCVSCCCTRPAVKALISTTTREQLEALGELADAGSLTPQISASFDLEDVADAYNHADAGRPAAKVVVLMCDQPDRSPPLIGAGSSADSAADSASTTSSITSASSSSYGA